MLRDWRSAGLGRVQCGDLFVVDVHGDLRGRRGEGGGEKPSVAMVRQLRPADHDRPQVRSGWRCCAARRRRSNGYLARRHDVEGVAARSLRYDMVPGLAFSFHHGADDARDHVLVQSHEDKVLGESGLRPFRSTHRAWCVVCQAQLCNRMWRGQPAAPPNSTSGSVPRAKQGWTVKVRSKRYHRGP